MTYLILLLSVLSLCDASAIGKGLFKRPLSDGNEIPALGLGTFPGFDKNGQKSGKNGEIENAVKWALEAGYRLVDSAAAYRNEDQVAAGVRASGVPREEVFIVTKIASNEQSDVLGALRGSLSRLNMSYVDLYLIHSPITYKPDLSDIDVIDYLDTWKGMEEAKKLGLAKSIGVSNFNVTMIERLLQNSQVKPAVLQVEVNINLVQEKLIDFCKANDIVVMGFTPFGSIFTKGGNTTKFDDPLLLKISKHHKKTVPQIALRYLIQKGVVPIPKSFNKNRIEANFQVFDFELTANDMENIGQLNQDYRTVLPSYWQEHPFYPYEHVAVTEKSPFKDWA